MVLVEDIMNKTGLRNRVKIYYDDANNYEYICDANKGAALTDKVWKIKRVLNDAVSWGTIDELVAGDGEYNLAATDLTLVESYTYA